MNKSYDYVIVGSGPTGLTLALLLSHYKYKVAILEKNNVIGGCHSVKRVNGLFSEHGPRIYIGNYLMFQKILSLMNSSFGDIFVPYNFGSQNAIKTIISTLTIREIMIIGRAFLTLNDSFKHISLLNFMKHHDFSMNAINCLDRIGRLTDGGGADQYTLYNFLQIINQNTLYTIYQPREPNDVLLFDIWRKALDNNGIDTYVNCNIYNIDTKNNLITNINTNMGNMIAKTFILAMPPYDINNFIIKYKINNAFDKPNKKFDIWSKKTNYITYIPVIFHWKEKIQLEKIWGMPVSSWGIGHIVLSDYMDFKNKSSKTVISTLITIHNKSDLLDKTPDDITDSKVLSKEVFRQLKSIYPNLIDPDYAIVSENYHNGTKWIPYHNAFMTTVHGYMDNLSPVYNNLYCCGVQNGHSSYSFTSLESSVVNAIALIHKLVSRAKYDFVIKEAITVRYVLFIILCIVMLIVLMCIL